MSIQVTEKTYKQKKEELLKVLYSGENLKLAEELLEEVHRNWQPHKKAEFEPLSEKDCLLITYGDGIVTETEKPLQTLNHFLETNCKEEITNVHLLPVFPYTSDDGFSVSDYTEITSDLGGWQEIEALGNKVGIMMDAVINHTSRSHEWFRKCCAGEFPYSEYYIECDPNADYSMVTRPRALPLLTQFETVNGRKWYWTTFSEDQIDLNFGCPYLLKEIIEVLLLYASKGARFIRLDAIGFAWKKMGTSCMHLEETHALVKLMRLMVSEIFPGTYIITETNVPHLENISYFGNGDEAHLVYQFPLPPLVLHTMLTGNTEKITQWARSLGETQLPERTSFFNFLASHDGIGVRPVDGILAEEEKQQMFQAVQNHGGRISYKQNPDGTKSPYELNINYMDALTDPDEPDDEVRAARFLAAQSIMLSIQGVPGIYYHSLLGSQNWQAGVEESGIPRRINREKLEFDELEKELGTSGTLRNRIFQGYLALLRARSGHEAFSPAAGQTILDYGNSMFALERQGCAGKKKVLVLINVTGDDIFIEKPVLGKDLLDSRKEKQIKTLQPYQILWMELL